MELSIIMQWMYNLEAVNFHLYSMVFLAATDDFQGPVNILCSLKIPIRVQNSATLSYSHWW